MNRADPQHPPAALETRWTDALVSSKGDFSPVILTTLEEMILERRQVEVQASTDKFFGTFTCLGGEVGWLYFDWAWRQFEVYPLENGNAQLIQNAHFAHKGLFGLLFG